MIRPEFVKRKLQLIAADLQRLLSFRHATLEEITGDFVKMAAVERLIERIVMRAIDINEHLISELASGREGKATRLIYRDTFLMLAEIGVYPADFADKISQSVGLRNILVHDYNDVDRRILHRSINTCLKDYQRYVEAVSGFLTSMDNNNSSPGHSP